jgi:hypothetical protein
MSVTATGDVVARRGGDGGLGGIVLRVVHLAVLVLVIAGTRKASAGPTDRGAIVPVSPST